MVSSKLTLLAFLPALATAAQLGINNWCGQTVYVAQSHCGSCDYGEEGKGKCLRDGGKPIAIAGGNGKGSERRIEYNRGGCGTSIKISKGDSSFRSGILQFEYNWPADGMYWDLSDLDGKGNGLVGTPFRNDNVKVSPTGAGEGQGTCLKIRCPAGKVCLDSYQHPADPNTRYCPANTGDMWLDLCQPNGGFNNKRETIAPAAVGGGVDRHHALNVPQEFRANEKVAEKREVAFTA
ncbi:hypothetical protein B0H66DRAFT_389196 [Apodospora peruviana]|uniref:Uncharacterized protein n=1 Tax=Apodospora peruviana TaxID=516989 RepID=A0AAE0HUQ0_9PEZI|nr:hypothetical protein B0H66DRAFT_389196 [Apodospora peruviana]